MKRAITALALISMVIGGCATTTSSPQRPQSSEDGTLSLLNVPTLVQDDWRVLNLKRPTEYRIVAIDDRLAIRARGDRSASGLVRELELDEDHCMQLAWSWRVDELQSKADIRLRAKEDVAAAVYVLFGDPGILALPNPVPTLRYVWTNDRFNHNEIVENPFMPGVIQTIVIRSGSEELGEWRVEERDLHADFTRAFGRAPTEPVHGVALFTDNDQTLEPVTAYYEWIELRCAT